MLSSKRGSLVEIAMAEFAKYSEISPQWTQVLPLPISNPHSL